MRNALVLLIALAVPLAALTINCDDDDNGGGDGTDTILSCYRPDTSNYSFPLEPVYRYIDGLGYTRRNDSVIFPDNSGCPTMLFFRGECGREWSFCEQQGYDLVNIEEDMGSWVSSWAACIFDDSTMCEEYLYQLGLCAPGQCSTYTQLDGCCNWEIINVAPYPKTAP